MQQQSAYEPRRLAMDRDDAAINLAKAREAIAADGLDAAAWERAGHALVRLARVEEARTAFERSIGLDAGRAGAHCGLGILLLRSEKLEQAAVTLRAAVAAEPATPRAYAGLCWVLRRLGRLEESIDAGRRALEFSPDAEARHYLAFTLLAAERPAEALTICDEALGEDAFDSAALAYKTSALGMLERREDGRRLSDFEHLLWMARIPSPEGGLSAFNRELADCVRQFPKRPFDPSQTLDLFADPPAPVRRLRAIFERGVAAYLNGLSLASAHPMMAARPARSDMEGWGTCMDASDVQEHHFHQHGWLSGVYYVEVPAVVQTGSARHDGCIEFCRFMQMSGTPVNSEFAVVRPEAGMLVLFPSYFYHRIVPFRGGERISIAVNLVASA